MAPTRKFPLSEAVLRKIRSHVKMHVEAFGENTVYLDTIGSIPGGRWLVEATSWPIKEAFEYFEKVGVGILDENNFTIRDMSYFEVEHSQIDVPVSFSIDKRIEADLIVMLDLYGHIYDAENRLRFYLASKLEKKYGRDYVKKLSKSVRERIEMEKKKNLLLVDDPRRGDLEYTQFSDLKKIIQGNEDFIATATERKRLIETLHFLNEIRTLVAHNNLIVADEIKRIQDACNVVRVILNNTT